MKKVWLIAGVLTLVFATTLQAETMTWSSDAGDFATKFWTEMFKGGGVGQPGNELAALGEGFHFQKAVLQSLYFDPGTGRWITTYAGGELLLNSSGPWLDKKKLRARNLTAINSSAFDPVTGTLDFVLACAGEFDNAPGVYFLVEASYTGIPRMQTTGKGKKKMVFQRGDGFSATITLSDTPLVP